MGFLRYIEGHPLEAHCVKQRLFDIWASQRTGKNSKTLTVSTIHHVSNTEFADEIKNTRREDNECITSHDVSSLFTSIPVTSALDIIKNKLGQDTELLNRTTISANNIIELLEFCLFNNYFLFQDQFFKQT